MSLKESVVRLDILSISEQMFTVFCYVVFNHFRLFVRKLCALCTLKWRLIIRYLPGEYSKTEHDYFEKLKKVQFSLVIFKAVRADLEQSYISDLEIDTLNIQVLILKTWIFLKPKQFWKSDFYFS